MSNKTFDDIMARLRELEIAEPFDMIVAIANGGLLPAALLHERTGLEVNVLRINFRDPDNRPRAAQPVLLREPDFSFTGKKILLADDRIKTGATIAFARQILAGAACVRTFAINGNADYALFNEDCFPMPWRCRRSADILVCGFAGLSSPATETTKMPTEPGDKNVAPTRRQECLRYV